MVFGCCVEGLAAQCIFLTWCCFWQELHIARQQQHHVDAHRGTTSMAPRVHATSLDACLALQAQEVGGAKVIVENIEGCDPNSLQKAAAALGERLGDPSAVVLGSAPPDGKVAFVTAFSPSLIKERKMSAGKFVGAVAKVCGGGGGGKPALAQAGGKQPEKLPEALDSAWAQLREQLA